jgi:membrane-associated protein
MLEGVPVVGSVVPGSGIVMALSALVPGGSLKLHWVLLAAGLGALLGDGSAFWVGHSRQHDILNTWPLSRHPHVVAESETFFHRFGTWAVFFARFVPGVRAFVPITAGALGMTPGRFYAINIPAVFVWTPVHVLPGVAAVSILHTYAGLPHHGHVGKTIWILTVAAGVIILALAIRIIRRRNGGKIVPPKPRG